MKILLNLLAIIISQNHKYKLVNFLSNKYSIKILKVKILRIMGSLHKIKAIKIQQIKISLYKIRPFFK
jgi:hypothetical protein